MKIQQLSAAQAIASLKSAPEGLIRPEAERRLREYGPNRVEKVRGETRLLSLLNRLIILGVLLEVAVIVPIVYTPLGNRFFGTAPLDLQVWLFLLPFAIVLLAGEEARKLGVRRMGLPRREDRI